MRYAFAQDRNEALRAWAKGIYPSEAGVELLIRSGWASKLDSAGWLRASEDPPSKYAEPRVGDFLRHAGYLSGGERRQITVIASFLGLLVDDGELVTDAYDTQLYEALPGVDQEFIRLVQSAVGHAAGLHEHGGNPLPWPEGD